MSEPTISAGLAARLRGKFVVFDGIDGCGKTTIAKMFCAAMQKHEDKNVRGPSAIQVREPGGTVYGEKIREVLLTVPPESDKPSEQLDAYAEMLLFMAARAQLMRTVVVPALQDGQAVFSDRFVSSTLAYQGSLGVSWKSIVDVAKNTLPPNCWPFCTFILDLPLHVARSRTSLRPSADRIEKRHADYFAKVRLAYTRQVFEFPAYTRFVDASLDIDTVFAKCCELLENFESLQSTE